MPSYLICVRRKFSRAHSLAERTVRQAIERLVIGSFSRQEVAAMRDLFFVRRILGKVAIASIAVRLTASHRTARPCP
jgi:hypothetical protein